MHILAYSILLKAGDKHSQLNDSQLHDFKHTINHQHPQLNHINLSTFSLLDHHYLNVNMVGSKNGSMMCRGDILRNHPLKSKDIIQSFHPDLLNKQSELHDTLNDIAMEHCTTIQVNCQSKPSIAIYGSLDQIEMTRIQILVMLDQQLGLHLDTLELPCYLHHLIAGRKHHHLQSIMEETGTNIYLTSPFFKLSDTQYMSLPVDQRVGVIHLTGSLQGIQRAKDLLMKLSSQKKKSMYHKDSIIKPTKLDWILRYQQTQLLKIMKDNGSVIIFPALGSGCNTITVYAENRVNAERTYRLLNYLEYDIYEVSFIFNSEEKKKDHHHVTNLFGSFENVSITLNQLSKLSGSEIIYDSENSQLDIIGSSHSVSQACQHISTMPFFKMNQPICRFSIEMASEQREFISGKKNGKINKIMKTCDVHLSFIPTNEYNVVITLESNDMTKTLSGLTMLQDELPAETSFYVPEAYHRRIIGVGGKNIQRVMKKYGVYVKFSGAEEFVSMGGYFESEHNVVARTPMKNKPNLYLLQEAVMEFINAEKDKNYTTTTISIPIHLHSYMAHQHSATLHELERIYHTRFIWPEKRLGKDQVTCYGPKSLLHHLIDFIQSKIPIELQFALFLNNNNNNNNNMEHRIQQDNDHKAILLKQNLQVKLSQYFPNLDLTILLQQHQLNHHPTHLNSTVTRVQWKFIPYSKDAIIYRLRYFEQNQQHIHMIMNVINQYCQKENISIEFESDFSHHYPLSSDDITLSSLQSQQQENIIFNTLPLNGANINLPPSPSTSPHGSSNHIPSFSLFDQNKITNETNTWPSFLYYQANNANHETNYDSSTSTSLLTSQHQDPLQHPLQQQPIRALFESIPSTSPPLSTSSIPKTQLKSSHSFPSSSFNTIHPLPSFSSPIPNPHYYQHHYQLQQQAFLLPSSYFQQPKRSFSISASSSSSSFSSTTTTSSTLSSYKNNSWLTPGHPISQTRSSCPDIFLAPDLFASTPLRRPSIASTDVNVQLYHII